MRSLSARPERLRELIGARPEVRQVVIDEVQKLPMLLEVVHLLIEEKQGVQFIFTGSSARKLRRGGVNLLGGRAAQRSFHPFMAAELGSLFNLEEALRLGMLPVVRGGKAPEEILRAYNGLYLREEVQMEVLVRNIGNFSRFLEAISFSQAAVLNLANVARDCHVNRKTVEGYLEILEDLRGIKSFGEDFPESRRWLLYRGKERFLRDGILCVPCEDFLLQLKPGEFRV